MTGATFDTLATTRNLEAAGVERAQAEANADAVRKAAGAGHDTLSTKADITDLKAYVDTKISSLEVRLLNRLYVAILGQAAVIVGLLKLFP